MHSGDTQTPASNGRGSATKGRFRTALMWIGVGTICAAMPLSVFYWKFLYSPVAIVSVRAGDSVVFRGAFEPIHGRSRVLPEGDDTLFLSLTVAGLSDEQVKELFSPEPYQRRVHLLHNGARYDFHSAAIDRGSDRFVTILFTVPRNVASCILQLGDETVSLPADVPEPDEEIVLR